MTHRTPIAGTLFALAGIAAMSGCATPGARPTPGHAIAALRATATHFVYSPYKHVAIALDPAARTLGTEVGGPNSPIVANGRSTLPHGLAALTLAFATGECGAETWEGVDPDVFAHANLQELDRAGIDYVVSTGGEAGTFTCQTDAGMEAFIARYASARLIGFDFDIERGQSDAIVESLVHRIKLAKDRHPGLRMSFTLATWAASDGSLASLNPDGERVLRALRNASMTDYYINLMVMDYGEATPRNCVVSGDVCQMGRSAIQAAHNLSRRHGVPLDRIELTPMIGINDVTTNVFSRDDAHAMARFVRDGGLAGLHYWSLDRDKPCAGGAAIVSSACSGLAGQAEFAFARAFRDGLGQ